MHRIKIFLLLAILCCIGLATTAVSAESPAVQITSPADGAVISGAVTIEAAAAHSAGIQQVEFFVNGTSIGTDTTVPYQMTLQSWNWPEGVTSIKAEATSADGSTGSNIVALSNGGEVAPSVVGYSPSSAAELPLDGAVEVTFDQAMDQTTTGSAIQMTDANGNAVAGSVTWTSARTARFKPAAALASDTDYQLSVGTAATSVLDQGLLEGLTIDFGTIGDIEVLSVSPLPGATAVDNNTTFSVIFNRPVVPLLSAGAQTALPNPLTIAPTVAGEGRWINTSTYVFQPDDGLIGGLAYSASVSAAVVNAASASGAQMAADYDWQFTVDNPSLLSIYQTGGSGNSYVNGSTKYARDIGWQVQFEQPMDIASTEAAINVSNGTVPVTFEWSDDARSVTLTPIDLLDYNTSYVVSVAATAEGAYGGTLRDPDSKSFTTVPLPFVVSTYPENGGTLYENGSFQIRFGTVVDMATVIDKIVFSPALPAGAVISPDEGNGRYMYVSGLDSRVTYNVTIQPGYLDTYGSPSTSTYTTQFTTEGKSPSGYLNMPNLVLHPTTDLNATTADYVNLTDYALNMYALDDTELRSVYSNNASNYQPAASKLRWTLTGASAQLDVTEQQPFYMTNNGTAAGSDLPAGAYYATFNSSTLSTWNNYHSDYAIILIANANLTLKNSGEDMLVWATDMETGAPLPNVTIQLTGDNTSHTAVTDADGVATFDGIDLSSWGSYVAHIDDPVFYGAVVNGAGAVTVNGINAGYTFNPERMKAYVYTDRPIYRPGQTVSFKGIVRHDDDLLYTLPSYSLVEVTITDPEGSAEVMNIPLADLKSFASELTLDEDASLGTYRISVSKSGGGYLGTISFEVAEYRKPTFQVDIAPSTDDLLAGGVVDALASAAYYSGGDVIGADVSWNVEATDYTFRPTGAYGRYSFEDSSYNNWWYYEDCWDCGWYGGSSGTIVASGSGQTDLDGDLPITMTSALDEDGNSQLYTIEATVTDASNNPVSGRSDVIIHKSAVYPGVKTASYVGRVGQDMQIDVVALDWDEAAVGSQSLTVEVVQTAWVYSGTQWIQQETIEQADTVTTNAQGNASVDFAPAEGGSYRARVTATDASGNTAVAATSFWVYGTNTASWQRDDDYTFDLIADADSYVPGDTAELLIASPYAGDATALITVERGRIKHHEVVALDGSLIYQLPITADMAPNVYVTVQIVQGSDFNAGSPDFKYNAIELQVDRIEQQLNVSITPNQSQATPGDNVIFTVEVTGHNGDPVVADVSLALADLAALSLRDRFEQPIIDYFYGEQPLAFRTSVSLMYDVEEAEIDPDGTPAPSPTQTPSLDDGAGGGVPEENFGGALLDADRDAVAVDGEVRENFPDTAYWRGLIRTGTDGIATVSVTFPDNLTTWQMDGKAATADTEVGESNIEIVSTKPLIIDPMAPRFFVVGDTAQVGATVHNNMTADVLVNASLDADGVVLYTPQTQLVAVPAGQTAYVKWDIGIEDVARVDFIFSASGNGESDASRPTLTTLPDGGIPVYKYEVQEIVGTSGQLLDGDVIVESISLPQYPNYQLTEGELVVEVAPSLAAAMTDGLDYLAHYEWECTEQIVSKFLPNAVSIRALRTAGLTDTALETNLENQVAIALAKLANRINPDGGFGWWNGNQSNTLVTAYVVLGLIEAQEAGITIDTTMLDNAATYVSQSLSSVDGLSGTWKLNRQAFLAYVLTRAGQSPTGTIDALYASRESMSLYAEGYLAQAMARNFAADARLDTLQSDITSAAILSASGTHWEEASTDYWNWNTDTRTTAIILDTMAQLDPTNPMVANAVRWLMAHRQNGHWGSTQETAWTLMALTDWMAVSGELNPDYDYEVALNGSLIAADSATAATVRETTELRVDIENMLLDEMNRLAIGRTEGDGNLYYTAFMDMSLPVEYVDALDRGFQLSRAYFDPTDPDTPVTEAQQGDMLLARLTVTIPNAMHYVAIEDYLPAGLEIIDESLNTAQQIGTPETYNPGYNSWFDWWWGGYGWWAFDHVDQRDEKVQLSADYLWEGTYEYTYLVRAVTPGEFRVIPPTAHEFYFPDVYGRGAGSLFTVHPAGGTYQPPAGAQTRAAEKAALVNTSTAAPEIGSDTITVIIESLPTAVTVDMLGVNVAVPTSALAGTLLVLIGSTVMIVRRQRGTAG